MSDIKIPKFSEEELENVEPTADMLSAEQLSEVNQEIETEKKYGDRPIESAAIGAASGLTFGLSNKLLKKLGYTEEDLREIDDRNKAAAITGEVLGTLAGLIPTGGASLAAKGVGLAGKGVRAAVRAGDVPEQLTVKALNKIISETGERKFAKEVIKKAIPKAAGSAVEGAAFSTGQLVKESELGRAEFNAENLAATVGTGALLGGAVGTGIGSAMPLFSPAIKVGKKAKNYAVKKIADLTDPEDAALDLIGATTTQKIIFKKYHPELVAELPEFLAKRAGLRKFGSSDELYKNIITLKEEAGAKIPELLKKIDEAAVTTPSITKTRNLALIPILKQLDESYIQKYAGKKAFRGQLNKVRQIRDDIFAEAQKGGKINAQTLQSLRQQADELAKFEKTPGKVTMGEQAARDVRRALRTEIDELAERAGRADLNLQNIAAELKTANKNFSIASQIEKPLAKKINKPERIASLTDLVAGDIAGDYGIDAAVGTIGIKKFLESDFRRRLSVLFHVEKQNQKVQSSISKGIKNFFNKDFKPVRQTAQATLVKSAIAEKVEDGKIKKPNNARTALKNVRDNITELVVNPQKLEKRLISSTGGLYKVAPETAAATQQIMLRALEFLNSKLPKDVHSSEGMAALARERHVSDLELSKFARYLSAIEDPLSVVEDLQSGTVTREQVEAVKVVYPDIYDRMVQETYQYIDDSKNKVSYNKKIQLGVLLDIPTDSSLRRDAVADLQTRFRPEPENATATGTQGQAGPSRLTVGGTKRMTIAQRENSEAQAFLRRRQS